MMVILTPLLVSVVGAFVYAISVNAKLAELARIAFFVGLLWLVYLFAHGTARF
jgi:hypothetical protein